MPKFTSRSRKRRKKLIANATLKNSDAKLLQRKRRKRSARILKSNKTRRRGKARRNVGTLKGQPRKSARQMQHLMQRSSHRLRRIQKRGRRPRRRRIALRLKKCKQMSNVRKKRRLQERKKKSRLRRKWKRRRRSSK